jgi:hypothetical protein
VSGYPPVSVIPHDSNQVTYPLYSAISAATEYVVIATLVTNVEDAVHAFEINAAQAGWIYLRVI